VILIDDGSTDRTGAIADALAASNPRIRVLHNARSKNLGGVFRDVIALARGEYLIMFPGDNEASIESLDGTLAAIGRAEIVVPYVEHDPRTRTRVVISRGYVWLLNALLGLDLRYYNGSVVHRVANLRTITIDTDSFAYQSEALCKLIRAGKSYVEIPVEHAQRGADPSAPARRSKALRVKNIVGVLKATVRMAWGLRR
jgi:glycosyltransferase involved in cell wall biosynthesis